MPTITALGCAVSGNNSGESKPQTVNKTTFLIIIL